MPSERGRLLPAAVAFPGGPPEDDLAGVALSLAEENKRGGKRGGGGGGGGVEGQGEWGRAGGGEEGSGGVGRERP